MKNEEKARVLSNKGCLGAYISRDAEALNPTEEDKQRLSLYGACLESMQWKDEQHAQEKQQWIDKAMKVICNGCAQKAECEFNNWKTCSTKDELIKLIKGE